MAKICVPVCVRHLNEVRGAVDAAEQAGDLVEIRADCLSDADPTLILQTLSRINRPFILTLRSNEQGGVTPYDLETRRRFWSSLDEWPADSFVDLELDLVEEFATRPSATALPVDWTRVICSHHDFKQVPDNLEQIFERLAGTPAGIIKIAVQASDAVDCLPILGLLARARSERREVIAIAMGEAGLMTRILGPSHGSFLTYGALAEGGGTAPGQVTAAELREVYRIDEIDRDTQIFGIIGQPITHSLSPHIHNAAFAAAGLNAVYIPFEVREAVQFIRRMAHPKTRELDWRLHGLSVTAPHKSTVIQCLDWIDPAAREIGAVNTIVVKDDELHGYNLDAAGFISPLRNLYGSIRDTRCAVIGAGGAARACVWALKNDGAEVVVFARDPGKAEFLAETFGVKCEQLARADFHGFDVVVNATPLGTRSEREHQTAANTEQLRDVRLAYDLVYNPLETRFIREARTAGCKLLTGIEMLLAQGEEQFKLWTGKQPDIEVMRSTALRKLRS